MNQNTARLIIAGSEECSDLYWATKFYVPDPIIFLEHKGKKILFASDLEVNRARKEAQVDEVLSLTEYDQKLKKKGVKRQQGDVLNLILKERKIKRLRVPFYFSLRQAEILRKYHYQVESLPPPFYPERQIKTLEEKKNIQESIRATEAGIQAAFDTLKKSIIKNGMIYYKGKLLTSEELRKIIEVTILENGALGQHTIVACGKQAADPHCRGFGPLYAHQPIVLDVFPKSIRTGYYADITRTVLKGHAPDALKKMYRAVREAQENGIRTIRAGINAAKVHKVVRETLDKSGFKTETKNGKPQGFIHSTGHGLGLDIHEPPRVSKLKTILKKGMVVTVEPGLYYEDLGGIRIEDDVFVTDGGREVLSGISKIFEIP